MMKIAQAESVGSVHTDSSLVKCVVFNNTIFVCDAQNLSMCNRVKYHIII